MALFFSFFHGKYGNIVGVVYDIFHDPHEKARRILTHDWPDIVDSHAALVVGAVRRIAGNNHDVEDIVQDVFLEGYQTSQKTEIRNWPGFLRRLATRRAIDWLRTRRARRLEPSTTEPDEVAGTSPQPHQHAEACELADRLRNAVALLPHSQAEVFSMRCFEEMTYEQIADALAMSSNAVGLALHKARSRLQILLAETTTSGDSP